MIRAPAISVFIAECFLNRAAENSRLLTRFISNTRSVVPVKQCLPQALRNKTKFLKMTESKVVWRIKASAGVAQALTLKIYSTDIELKQTNAIELIFSRLTVSLHHTLSSICRRVQSRVSIYHCFNVSNTFNWVIHSSFSHFFQDLQIKLIMTT